MVVSREYGLRFRDNEMGKEFKKLLLGMVQGLP